MPLPKNVKRKVDGYLYIKGMIYANAGFGKTTLVDDESLNTLMLNTDGNIDQSTSPVELIKDWDHFVSTVDEIEEAVLNGTFEFQTVAVDLIDDIYEMCRKKTCDIREITHESDEEYGKAYDAIRLQFLATINRLIKLPINLFLLGHPAEKQTTSSFNKNKKYTYYLPFMTEKVYKKLAARLQFVAHGKNEDIIDAKDDVIGTNKILVLHETKTEYASCRLSNKETIPFSLDNIYQLLLETNNYLEEKGDK